jgi:hypothetical protein
MHSKSFCFFKKSRFLHFFPRFLKKCDFFNFRDFVKNDGFSKIAKTAKIADFVIFAKMAKNDGFSGFSKTAKTPKNPQFLGFFKNRKNPQKPPTF